MNDNLIPTREPDVLTAGDTATWKRDFEGYPASAGWVLSYVLAELSGATQVTFAASANGTGYLVTVPAAQTGQWAPGTYRGQGYMTLGEERYTVWEGEIEVKANLAGGPAGDQRSHARIVLEAIEAVLEKRATHEVLEFTVEGTVLRKAPVEELLRLRDRYTVMVQKEEARLRAKQGKGTGRRVLLQFTRPGGQRNGWPPGVVR